MVKYVLHYYNFIGRAEQARLMFELAGVDYTYKTYGKDWAEVSQNGKYPYLWPKTSLWSLCCGGSCIFVHVQAKNFVCLHFIPQFNLDDKQNSFT